jgi:imidazole glycerol phosphate synthase glutamine amidotransferase subunit
MSGKTVSIVPTGTANLASVEAALARCGGSPQRVERPQEIVDAELLIVPGVGTLAAAVERLESRGFFEPLAERLRRQRPTLAICVGMQLLATGSDESPGVAGLGVLAARARRFPDTVQVPQIGWNRVAPEAESDWVDPSYAYFANSYYLPATAAPGWKGLYADHGLPFLAGAARGRVLACQFHPELSGEWGHTLLSWWLAGGAA